MWREEDRRRIIDIVKWYCFNYSKDIYLEDISNILNDCWYDFYIEDLVPNCWEWGHYYYLDYYDKNAKAVICIDTYNYVNRFADEEEIADLILSMEDRVNKYKNKFSFLEQEKWNGIG